MCPSIETGKEEEEDEEATAHVGAEERRKNPIFLLKDSTTDRALRKTIYLPID